MIFQISVVLHIIGFTFLVGGLLVGLRAGRLSKPPAELLKAIRFGYIVAGSFLVLVTGFYQLMSRGFAFYLSQSWFHGKLTAALYLFGKLAEVENTGQPLTRRFTAIMHSVIGLLLLAAVAEVILGRQVLM